MKYKQTSLRLFFLLFLIIAVDNNNNNNTQRKKEVERERENDEKFGWPGDSTRRGSFFVVIVFEQYQ